MHAPSTLHGALWWGAVNIVWVITHECAGHNSQHSCCLCTNSQGTPSLFQWDLFLKILSAPVFIHGRENHCHFIAPSLTFHLMKIL